MTTFQMWAVKLPESSSQEFALGEDTKRFMTNDLDDASRYAEQLTDALGKDCFAVRVDVTMSQSSAE